MAIEFITSPTSPNIVNNNLVYMVSSSLATNPQYQYVVDIKDYDDNLIQRIKQQPNPNNLGVFDVGKILTYNSDNIGGGQNAKYRNNIPFNTLNAYHKDFKLYFGEEYGTSLTSSITIYNGEGLTGDPAVTASECLVTTKGTLDISEQTNGYNWASSSKYQPYFLVSNGYVLNAQNEAVRDATLELDNVWLTDFNNTSSLTPDDYMTLHFFVGDLEGNNQGYNGMLPGGVIIENAKDANGNSVSLSGQERIGWQYNNPYNTSTLSPIIEILDPAYDIFGRWDWYQQNKGGVDYDPSTQIVSLPMGPLNMRDGFIPNFSQVRSYDIKVVGYSSGYATSHTKGANLNGFNNDLLYDGGCLVFLDSTATGITGSYPSAPGTLRIQEPKPPYTSVDITFTQSDALLFNYPIATAEQLAYDINTACSAAGVNVTASVYPVESQGDTPREAGVSFPSNGDKLDKYLRITSDYSITNSYLFCENRVNDARGNPICDQNSASNLNSGTALQYASIAYRTVGTIPSNPFLNEYITIGRWHVEVDQETNNCGYETKRFSWKNKYGVWDYYNFTLAESITDNIDRKSFKQSHVDFSAGTGSVNTSRRGETQYYNKITKQYKVESNWLTQEEADVIKEMFFSTEVYLQPYGTGLQPMLPVVITNATITEKTNPRTQKLFRYSVEYQYANEIQPRI